MATGVTFALGGDFTADERMAAFLITLSRRYALRGFSATRLRLAMSRTDIGNYLRLAPETVSRVLRRLQDMKVLRIDRREVELLNHDYLHALGRPILRE